MGQGEGDCAPLRFQAKGLPPMPVGAGSMVGVWGLGATWVLLCGSQIRELVRLGQGQPG